MARRLSPQTTSADAPLAITDALFEQSQIPMALLDADRRYVKVNQAAITVFQYPMEDVIGARAARTALDEDPLTGQAQWDQLVSTGEVYGERVVQHACGAPIRVSFAGHATSVNGRWLALLVALSVHLEPDGRELIRTPERELWGNGAAGLTAREREIVRSVALGRTTQQIADELILSRNTIRTHIRNAMGKTGAHTSAQLVAIALTRGLIEA